MFLPAEPALRRRCIVGLSAISDVGQSGKPLASSGWLKRAQKESNMNMRTLVLAAVGLWLLIAASVGLASSDDEASAPQHQLRYLEASELT